MRLLFALALLFVSNYSIAQLNVELRSNKTYNSEGNDVWGYTDVNGREYALFGTFDGVSIVNITNPDVPAEVDFIDQQGSSWRDIKTWENFAYVVADQSGTTDGILVIDMSTAPNSVEWTNLVVSLPDLDNPNNNFYIDRCHNLYIDENGFMYLSGCSGVSDLNPEVERINRGGLLIFDCNQDPLAPSFVGQGADVYSHDIFVRNNIAYSSEVDLGVFSIYDVSDKTNIELLAQQSTPFEFTHNAWPSENDNFLFTTDEKANASVAAYDISDYGDIQLLDQYRPAESLNSGVIPHNVHVKEDWLVISYYTDGVRIVDASRPHNLVEVGAFDTYQGAEVGFEGAWGAYPFFDSGNIIVGDINSGLYTLSPNYIKAAYLEGLVLDSETMDPINGATIRLVELDLEDVSDAKGEFATGTPESGIYTFEVSKSGYETYTQGVRLENGNLNFKTVLLEKTRRINLTGTVKTASTNEGIQNAQIELWKDGEAIEVTSGNFGIFSVTDMLPGNYWIVAGKWGFKYNILGVVEIGSTNMNPTLDIRLDRGFEDIFTLDLGWETNFMGDQGAWERTAPKGTSIDELDFDISPGNDSKDRGVSAFVTGNGSNVDEGNLLGRAELTSPSIYVLNLERPVINFEYWYWAAMLPDTAVEARASLYLINGLDTVAIESFDQQSTEAPEWQSFNIDVRSLVTPTPDLRLHIEIMNSDNSVLVEMGVDNFSVIDEPLSSLSDLTLPSTINIFPNPFKESVVIESLDWKNDLDGQFQIFNSQGRLVHTSRLQGVRTDYDLSHLDSGLYLFAIVESGKVKHTRLVVKE